MTLIEKLSDQLVNMLGKHEAELIYGRDGLRLLQQKTEALKRKFNKTAFDQIPTDKLIGIRSKIESQGMASLSNRDLQKICSGVTSKTGKYSALISDKLFVVFIARIRQLSERGELKVRAWRGLLSSYFTCLPDEQSRNNWKTLRTFLFETFSSLFISSKYKPIWMLELDKNRNLLTEEPCEKYAKSILNGDNELVDGISKNLPILENSWFWTELILAQVSKAALMNDNDFKSHVDYLVAEIKKHPSQIDKSLVILLSRYVECDSQKANETLKLLALENWKSPFLTVNDKWGGVEPKVRQMVKSWLIYDDLRDFFELLMSDGVGDQRRLKFWLKFLQQIEDAKIALGDFAYYNSSKDYMEVKGKRLKDGRLARLTGGEKHNNAFLMRIAQFLFVEFGASGNACYVYDSNNIGFNINSKIFHIKNNLKSGATRWIHRDSSWESWEEKFESNLRRLGILADKTEPEREVVRRGTQQEESQDRFTEDDFIRFIMAHKIKYNDLRDAGGYLWVNWTLPEGEEAETLIQMGFKLRPNIGYWRK